MRVARKPRIWLAHRFWDFGYYARQAWLCSLEVHTSLSFLSERANADMARWLYFIEGAVTIAVAIAAIFILPDFPENSSSWLSPAEQALAIQRMKEDARHSIHGEYISEYAGFKMAMLDWKIWWMALTYAAVFLSISFNAYYPTLTATLGYSRKISLVLVAPPPILVSILSFFYARYCRLFSSQIPYTYFL